MADSLNMGMLLEQLLDAENEFESIGDDGVVDQDGRLLTGVDFDGENVVLIFSEFTGGVS